MINTWESRVLCPQFESSRERDIVLTPPRGETGSVWIHSLCQYSRTPLLSTHQPRKGAEDDEQRPLPREEPFGCLFSLEPSLITVLTTR